MTAFAGTASALVFVSEPVTGSWAGAGLAGLGVWAGGGGGSVVKYWVITSAGTGGVDVCMGRDQGVPSCVGLL